MEPQIGLPSFSNRESKVMEIHKSDPTPVYNLTVLVRTSPTSVVTARAANLQLAEVEATTIRGALSSVVESAKRVIREKTESDSPIPWIDPPCEPQKSESRFVVPLHL